MRWTDAFCDVHRSCADTPDSLESTIGRLGCFFACPRPGPSAAQTGIYQLRCSVPAVFSLSTATPPPPPRHHKHKFHITADIFYRARDHSKTHALFFGQIPSLSCHVLPCPVLSCPVLSCPVLSCPVLSCPVLSCPVLSCPVPSCPALLCPALPCPALPCPVVCPEQRPVPKRKLGRRRSELPESVGQTARSSAAPGERRGRPRADNIRAVHAGGRVAG